MAEPACTLGVVAPRPQLLVVCTGNICRSPVGAALLAQAFPDLEVVSAGTRADVGAPADPTTAAVAAGLGLDLSAHRGTQLTSELVRASQLVLTMTREHRSSVVELVPSALRRTFTLLELARLLPARRPWTQAPEAPPGAGPGEILLALAGRAVRARHPNPAGHAADDVRDPYGAPSAVHELVLAEIAEAARALAGATAPGEVPGARHSAG